MTDTAKYLTALADWFVLKGGEVRYDINRFGSDDQDFDCERPSGPVMHEVLIDGLQVFVGEAFDDNAVAEVGVVLRTGIPLPEAVVEESVAGLRAAAPDRVSVDVIEGAEEGPGVSVWLVTSLDSDEIDNGTFDLVIAALLALAHGDDAREVRAG